MLPLGYSSSVLSGRLTRRRLSNRRRLSTWGFSLVQQVHQLVANSNSIKLDGLNTLILHQKLILSLIGGVGAGGVHEIRLGGILKPAQRARRSIKIVSLQNAPPGPLQTLSLERSRLPLGPDAAFRLSLEPDQTCGCSKAQKTSKRRA